MRTITLAIVGAPFAAWALHGCLVILGLGGMLAFGASAAWGVAWLAIAHVGPNAKIFRRRASGSRGIPGGRGVWTGAVLGSSFLPLPVYAVSVGLEWLRIADASLTLPLIGMLALPVPGALWGMLLWPSPADQDGEMVRPPGWRKFTPHVSSRAIRRDEAREG